MYTNFDLYCRLKDMNIFSVISPDTHEDFKDCSTFLKGRVLSFQAKGPVPGVCFPAGHPCCFLLLDAGTGGSVHSSPSGCVSHGSDFVLLQS